MTSPARNLCYQFLGKIESRSLFSDDALNSEAMMQVEVRDRHLTTEIVYGTLRWQALLDYILGSICSRPWDEVDPGARILLRMSLYQMCYMDRIPEYALVNDAVELAKKNLGKGIDGFVNGVLRNLARKQPWKQKALLEQAPEWIRASLPQWLWNRWSARYGQERAMEFALSLNCPPQAAFRFMDSAHEMENSKPGIAKSALVPGAYMRAVVTEAETAQESVAETIRCQDEASQLIPYLLNPQSGWIMWDACAAPGGKTEILSKAAGTSGCVIASDFKKERARKMRRFLRDAGAGNAHVVVADASQDPPFYQGFDAVLVDVPCSGMGTLRRNPEIKWSFQPDAFSELQQTQANILHHASTSVRVGGRLLYSTCSTEPEENEQVIQSFLTTHGDFSLTKPEFPPGIDNWTSPDGMVRTFPSSYLWDGFFAAMMARNS
jgi:16S rRNA (cytosine967-C5)-methyltransferase